MTEAIFGLVGVVIGGLLNGGVAWIAEWRRNKREARIATRLVAAEIDDNQLAFKKVAQFGHYGSLLFAGTDAWDAWRETLANVLSAAEWNAVWGYYHVAGIVLWFAEDREYPDIDDGSVEILKSVEEVEEAGHTALEQIQRYTGLKHV